MGVGAVTMDKIYEKSSSFYVKCVIRENFNLCQHFCLNIPTSSFNPPRKCCPNVLPNHINTDISFRESFILYPSYILFISSTTDVRILSVS